MTVYAVQYRYSPELAGERQSARPQHNEWLQSLIARGTALCTGPFADGSGGLLIFESPSRLDLDEILAGDPFSVHNLIHETVIHEWKPLHGRVG
ncbi:hypothetical protein E4P29_11865 [Rhodococcus sp. 1R11]|nr:hypothetical protein E4P29_11865 [Rhodococcus sp. 1R11]